MRNPCGTHTFHFKILCQYSVHWHFWHVQEACRCSSGQMLIFFIHGSNGVCVDFSHRSSWPTTSWCIVKLTFNYPWILYATFYCLNYSEVCLQKPYLVKYLSLREFLQTEHKIQCKRAAWFSNSFFANQTTLHFACTVSLPACKNHAIHRTTFILASKDAKNQQKLSSFQEYLLYVYNLPTSPHTSIQRHRLLTDGCWSLWSLGF